MVDSVSGRCVMKHEQRNYFCIVLDAIRLSPN